MALWFLYLCLILSLFTPCILVLWVSGRDIRYCGNLPYFLTCGEGFGLSYILHLGNIDIELFISKSFLYDIQLVIKVLKNSCYFICLLNKCLLILGIISL